MKTIEKTISFETSKHIQSVNRKIIWRAVMNVGEKYSKLTILKEVANTHTSRMFLCECECWNKAEVSINNLRQLRTKSCWCLVAVGNIKTNKTHWLNWSRIHSIFYNMLARCNNPKSNRFNHYWWRGIKCLWNKFEDFHEDMKDTYSDNLQIDRIDVNWNYCKENCRWADSTTQARNKRNNVLYKWKTLAEMREQYNISKWAFDYMRYTKKMPLEDIFLSYATIPIWQRFT